MLFVALALVALLLGWPGLLRSDGSLLGDWLGFGVVVLMYVGVSLPFDLVGEWPRMGANWREFGRKLFVGIIVHAAVYWLMGGLLLVAGRAGCLSGGLGVVGGVMVLQVQFQTQLAQVVGQMRRVRPNLDAEGRRLRRHGLAFDNVLVLDAVDKGFCGGFSGRLGLAQLVIPAHWLSESGTEYASMQMLRRAGALRRGGRGKGVVLGGALNLVLLTVASLLPNAGFGSAEQLLTTLLYMTLFSPFILLLTLIPTRAGVHECDYFAAKKGIPKRILRKVWRETAWLTAGVTDVERAVQFDGVRPIPPIATRLQNILQEPPTYAGWNAQQMTLYLSWACCGFLSRAIFVQGRPERWVFLPCD